MWNFKFKEDNIFCYILLVQLVDGHPLLRGSI